MPKTLISEVLDVGKNTLENGGLFHGSFKNFGGFWFSVTLWCTIGTGIIYLGMGIVAIAINKRYKNIYSAIIPAITALYGCIVGFTIGALSATAIAAMYNTGPYTMQWVVAGVWGLGLTGFHIVASLARGILR